MDFNDRQDNKTIYLDYNATTPLAPSVIKIINESLRDAWGNPSSSHEAGKKAKEVINVARSRVANMVGAQEDDIIFTSGGTESNNTVFWSVLQHYRLHRTKSDNLKEIPHIISSNIEHDSVCLAIDHLVECGHCENSIVEVSSQSGQVDVDKVLEKVKPNTCLISIMMANNETGIIQPIGEITSKIKELQLERDKARFPKIHVHTDAAQTLGKVVVDVTNLGVDYLTIVGHKFYGPRIGALYVKCPSKETPLYPMLFGGGQERGYRPGTENTAMIAGLGEAAQLVVNNLDTYSKHMQKVRDYLEKRLLEMFPNQIRINGKFNTSDRIPNTCNFSILGDQFRGYHVLSHLKRTQVSLGAACHSGLQFAPSHILLAMGIGQEIACNALRASVGRETSFSDIDAVLNDLQQAVTALQDK